MKIDIFDVGHGACSVITCPDGKMLMIDCGSKSDAPYWWPSIHLYGQRLAGLILTNLDEDHVSDFESTLKHLHVETVCINDTIDALRLKRLKLAGMRTGVEAVHHYLQTPTCLNLKLNLPQLRVTMFRHPFGVFDDTNNLSMVTFVEYARFCIVYPGDLEEIGWKEMLKNQTFSALLSRVNLFVTSHHGRQSGCCAQVFESGHCSPHAFIVSDKEMIHDSQETSAWYRGHAKGVHKILENPWEAPETRYVFTTRSDACISINVKPDGDFVLYPKSAVQQNVWPKTSSAPTTDWGALLMGLNLNGSGKEVG